MMPASMLDQVRMMRDWAPLVGFGRRYVAAGNPRERAIVVGDAMEWIASKTASTLDDRFAAHIAAILKTPEGESFVRDLVAIVESLPDQKEPNK